MKLASRSRPTSVSVRNVTRNTLVGNSIDKATSSSERRTGLLNHTHLADGSGLWIVPCQAIHMFFMRFPVDVIYIDKKRRVRKTVRNLAPWRISMCFAADSVIETPAGTIDRTRTQAGDQLEMISPTINPAG